MPPVSTAPAPVNAAKVKDKVEKKESNKPVVLDKAPDLAKP